jgi:hypothetical protein
MFGAQGGEACREDRRSSDQHNDTRAITVELRVYHILKGSQRQILRPRLGEKIKGVFEAVYTS